MSELSEALGKGKELDWNGGKWHCLPLDLNDLADIEDRVGDVDLLDLTKISHQRLILWLVLRKADPALSPAEREACAYKMTERQVGKLVNASQLQKAETVEFLLSILKVSGLMPGADMSRGATGAEQDEGNAQPPEAASEKASGG